MAGSFVSQNLRIFKNYIAWFFLIYLITPEAAAIYFHADVSYENAVQQAKGKYGVVILDERDGCIASGLIIRNKDTDEKAVLTTGHLNNKDYKSIFFEGKKFIVQKIERPSFSFEADLSKLNMGDCHPSTYGDLVLLFIQENEEWNTIRPLTSTHYIPSNYSWEGNEIGGMLGGGPAGIVDSVTKKAKLLRTKEGSPSVGVILATTMRLQSFPLATLTHLQGRDLSSSPLVVPCSRFVDRNNTELEGIGTVGDSGAAVFKVDDSGQWNTLLALQSSCAPSCYFTNSRYRLFSVLFHSICKVAYQYINLPILGKLAEKVGLTNYLLEEQHRRDYGSVAYFTPLSPWKKWIEESIATHYANEKN